MDNIRSRSFELTIVRPSFDISDCGRFEALSEMELGGQPQPKSLVNSDQNQPEPAPDSTNTIWTSEEDTTDSVPSDPSPAVQAQPGLMKRMKSFVNPLFASYSQKRKNLIVIGKRKCFILGTYNGKVLTLRYLVVEHHPIGYPRLASYINSDPNFAMYRRFGYLHNRVLLYRQDELCVLQERLETLDEEDEEADPKVLKCRERDDENSPKRKDLIAEIDVKMREYGLSYNSCPICES
jgi:hypothetical protein